MFGSPQEDLLLILISGTVHALFSGLAIWVALANWPHWFLRSGLLLAAIALMLPVDAYEATIFFLLQSVLIVGSLIVAKALWTHARRSKASDAAAGLLQLPIALQLKLRDLLLGMTLVAAAIAVATVTESHFPIAGWDELSPLVVSGWLVTLGATLVFLAPGRLIWRALYLALLVVAVLCSWEVSARTSWLGVFQAGLQERFTIEVNSTMLHAILVTGIALILRVAIQTGPGAAADPFADCPERKKTSAIRRVAKISAVGLGVLVAIPLSIIYWMMATPPPIPASRSGEPNGYPEVLKFGKLLHNVTVPERDSAPAALTTFVNKYASDLASASNVLKGPCFMPVQYEDLDFLSLSANRQVARALVAQGLVAENENRNQDAIEHYLDAIRLSHATAADGLLVDYLVGVAIESMGHDALRQLRGKLDSAQCRYLLNQMLQIEDGFDPVSEYCDRDRTWSYHAYGWQGRLVTVVAIVTKKQQELESSFIATRQRRNSTYRLLLTELALKSFQHERNVVPQSLDELVPDYLADVPYDPYDAGPLTYRKLNDDRYLLYSVGQNGKDDNGSIVTEKGEVIPATVFLNGRDKEAGWIPLTQGDLFLDQPDWQPE